ncbi:hypothetical protein ACFE04_009600 [Oxalis oulophora]
MIGHSKIKFLFSANGQVNDQGSSIWVLNQFEIPFAPSYIVSDVDQDSKNGKLNRNAFPFDPNRNSVLEQTSYKPKRNIKHFFERQEGASKIILRRRCRQSGQGRFYSLGKLGFIS